MSKPVRNILCYSHYDFDNIMKSNNWINKPGAKVSCVSICSPNEYDLSDHWFKFDVNKSKVHGRHVFNLDIEDGHPYWFGEWENDIYDKALDLYNAGKIKESNAYFNYLDTTASEFTMLHVLDYEEAFKLVKWIDFEIKHSHTFYIHCAAGISRSQAVVRYIRDIYGYKYDIKLNPNNPNNTYNPHIVMMLKRAYRSISNF